MRKKMYYSKRCGHPFVTKLSLAALAASLPFLSLKAQVFTISDGNASADLNVGTQAGMFNWSIAGLDQLNQQWFWFRVGPNPEAPINTISAPVVTTYNGTRGLTTTYANALFSIRVDYSIAGGLLSGRKSDISEQITIENLSTNTPLDIHFFQYSDFNLGSGLGGDTVLFGPPNGLTGKYNVVDQIKPGVAFHEGVVTPGADRVEASIVPGTLAKLNDGNPDILNNNLGAGPGNVTWAFQWDFLLSPVGGPNSSALISKDKYVELAVVPEPTSVALLLLGGLALAARRSKTI